MRLAGEVLNGFDFLTGIVESDNASVAQLDSEQLPCKHQAGGSSPLTGSWVCGETGHHTALSRQRLRVQIPPHSYEQEEAEGVHPVGLLHGCGR